MQGGSICAGGAPWWSRGEVQGGAWHWWGRGTEGRGRVVEQGQGCGSEKVAGTGEKRAPRLSGYSGAWGVVQGQTSVGEGLRRGCWGPGRAGARLAAQSVWLRPVYAEPHPLAELPSSFTPCRRWPVSSFSLLEASLLPGQVCAAGRNLGLPRASGLPLVRRRVAVFPGDHFHLPTIFSESVRPELRGTAAASGSGPPHGPWSWVLEMAGDPSSLPFPR